MALKPVENYPAGGVDSRSNPISMPPDRCLEVHDFWPQQDGSYRLRDGYALLVDGLQANVPIYSVASVNGPSGAQVNTDTSSAVTSTGVVVSVSVVSAANMAAGNQLLVDSGSNEETVTILSVTQGFIFRHQYIPPQITAVFTKTHASGVQLVGVAAPAVPIVVFWQNKTPYILNQQTNTVSTPQVKGAAIQSGARFSYFYANGHLHAFNGTDAKWFDGAVWRDIGLPVLTAAQAAAISITPGLEAITPTQASGVSVAFSSGGGWSGTAAYQFCFAFFDTATDILAASPLTLGSGPVAGANGDKLTLSNLPVSPISTAVGLVSAIINNGTQNGAAFFYDSSKGTAGILNVTASSASGTTVTLTIPSHGLSTGAVLVLNSPSGYLSLPTYGPFTVTVVNSNTITFQSAAATLYGGNACVGSALCLLAVPNGTTSFVTDYNTNDGEQGISFNADGQNLLPYANDTTQIVGLPASTIGGDQPGYQIYACIYNLVTGHVGNRTLLGFRIDNTATIASLNFTGCPVFADSEWVMLLGRTGDGAEIPYAIVDNYGNWQFVANGQSTFTLLPYGIDGNSELPSRNYPPPGTLDCNYQYSLLPGGSAQNPPIGSTFVDAWLESDHCCGILENSATVYRSGSALDMREGQFVGLPEQCWDPADIETFPTNSPMVAGKGYQSESWCFTAEDCAILMELNGETSWQGPYNVGLAGPHAWTRGWQNLPFWITGEKQLATVSLGGYQQLAGLMSQASAGPMLISNEYEAALLANIGDAYLNQTEICYIRKPLEMLEVLRIKCFDVNGNPFTVIHDFNLRDDRSPYGQAYEEIFEGPLATSFTQAAIRDENTRPQVVAGAANGNLYMLYDGGNDAGTEFTAQALKLIYVGPQRTAVKFFEWYGDRNLQVFLAKKLNTPFNVDQMQNLCQESPTEVQGQEGDSHWSVSIDKPEMVHVYLLLQLKSHSADGTTALNNPPHMPVETYGRIWLVAPQTGASRPR